MANRKKRRGKYPFVAVKPPKQFKRGGKCRKRGNRGINTKNIKSLVEERKGVKGLW